MERSELIKLLRMLIAHGVYYGIAEITIRDRF